MNKAYIILVHKGPDQLRRLIEALDDGQSHFYVHVDKRSDMRSFEAVQDGSHKIRWLPRERTSWASMGIVKAALHGLRAAHSSGHSFNRVILLSGQCYPIRSNAFINGFVNEHSDKTFLEYFHLPAPEKWEPAGGLYRVNKYFIGFKAHERLVSKTLNFLSRYLVFLRRRVYKNMKPYAGSMWWMLNMPAVEYILNFVNTHPGYTDFHRFTFAPDEVFFHTILMNAPPNELPGAIVNTDNRYIKWKDPSSSHPEPITRNDLPGMLHSNALFARKFDPERDNTVLDLIDNYRLTNH